MIFVQFRETLIRLGPFYVKESAILLNLFLILFRSASYVAM
jgi:hypothetical protein